jgi:hypothetical protein
MLKNSQLLRLFSLGIILVIAILQAQLQYKLANDILLRLDVTTKQFTETVGIVQWIFSMLAYCGVWILFFLLFYCASILLDGDGTISDFLVLVGFGFIPSLLVRSYNLFYLLPTIVRDILREVNDPASIGKIMQQNQTIQSVSTMNLAADAFVCIWSIFCVAKAYRLSYLYSVYAVIIPLGCLYLLRVIFQSL